MDRGTDVAQEFVVGAPRWRDNDDLHIGGGTINLLIKLTYVPLFEYLSRNFNNGQTVTELKAVPIDCAFQVDLAEPLFTE